MHIGVLALQGGFAAHVKHLQQLAARWSYVRQPQELNDIDGLIIPGGESSTFLYLIKQAGLLPALNKFNQYKKPIFGTCAGTILLAKQVSQPEQESLGWLDIDVERNAYGRQIDSHLASGNTILSDKPMEMMFIRPPAIRRVGSQVQALAEYNGAPVAVQQGHILATTFHPELSNNLLFHERFLALMHT